MGKFTAMRRLMGVPLGRPPDGGRAAEIGQAILGEHPLVLDREFSYSSLLRALVWG